MLVVPDVGAFAPLASCHCDRLISSVLTDSPLRFRPVLVAASVAQVAAAAGARGGRRDVRRPAAQTAADDAAERAAGAAPGQGESRKGGKAGGTPRSLIHCMGRGLTAKEERMVKKIQASEGTRVFSAPLEIFHKNNSRT